ncbi:MAG: hypothetical protein CL925_15250 [Deltaproteobacteria bacterium]|nr:hypothetical protein [Deltaproteobacteria bacterium]
MIHEGQREVPKNTRIFSCVSPLEDGVKTITPSTRTSSPVFIFHYSSSLKSFLFFLWRDERG